jgi:hypothetical protein
MELLLHEEDTREARWRELPACSIRHGSKLKRKSFSGWSTTMSMNSEMRFVSFRRRFGPLLVYTATSDEK